MDLWRLIKYRSLSGEGGRLYAARWNSAGAPIVYLADSPGSALVEILAHLEIEDDEIPTDFLWLRVTAPDSLVVPPLSTSNQEEWQSDVPFTRGRGDAWLKSQRSALARVPSALLPRTFNYLLNPLHVDANRIKIVEAFAAALDTRLVRRK